MFFTMAKVRVLKIYEERPIIARNGKLLYIVQSAVNFIVEQDREYVVNIFTGFPISEGQEYEFSLNNMNIRLKDQKLIPGPIPGPVPGPIPGPIPGINAKNPK
jgi:hypothetical protein